MEYRAWLNAVPMTGKNKRASQSRIQQYRSLTGRNPKMPPVKYGSFLIELVHELGPAMRTANGLDPIPFYEIDSWIRCSGARVTQWESITLRLMSEAYARQAAVADQPDAEQPWGGEPDTRSQSQKMAGAFKERKKAQEKARKQRRL